MIRESRLLKKVPIIFCSGKDGIIASNFENSVLLTICIVPEAALLFICTDHNALSKNRKYESKVSCAGISALICWLKPQVVSVKVFFPILAIHVHKIEPAGASCATDIPSVDKCLFAQSQSVPELVSYVEALMSEDVKNKDKVRIEALNILKGINDKHREGVLWRILLYAIGFFMTFSFMVFMPEKHLLVSYIGTRTMAIYLFHGLTYTYLDQCTKLLTKRNNVIETILLLIFCAAVTWIFSLKPFTAFTNLFSNIHLYKNKK